MNITVNKPRTGKRTLTLDLNAREAQLFTALVGGSNAYWLAGRINSSIGGTKTTVDEIDNFLGTDAYRKLNSVIDDLFPNVVKIVEFVYDKEKYGESPKWRNLHVTGEDASYIEGLEDGTTFKRFLKSRITGGKIITVG
jgi:hypothetical protein